MLSRIWDWVRRVNWRPWLLGAYALSVLVVAVPKGLHHSDNNFLIFDAIKQGASDIHIEPHEKRLVVRFRIDGVLFEAKNPAALAQAFDRVAGDDGLRRRLGEAARAKVERDLNWDSNARKVIEIYERLRQRRGQ